MDQAAPLSLAPQRMSRVDTAWLHMDNDVNLMMIVGVWLLAPAVDLAAVRDRVRRRLVPLDRFRSRAVSDPLGAQWLPDTDFDLDRHVLAQPLPSGHASEQAALWALCGELASTALDPKRPLWQIHLIPSYGAGSALVIRVHHCIADGIALISVMNSIVDGGPDRPPRRPGARAGAAGSDGWAEAIVRPLSDMVARAMDMGGTAAASSSPAAPSGSAVLAHAGGQLLGDLVALALMPDDAPTRLKGALSGRKVVAWSEPLPLDAVKAVGRALGCSINDVLLATVAGAIGGWLACQGDDPAGQEIRAMVPVNLRPADQAWQLGNRFGLAPLSLPIGLPNPVERVYAVHHRMAGLKGSYQPLLAYGLLSLTGLMSKPLQDAVLGLLARKATAVMTNVPGPREALRFCGARLEQSLFWVPSSGDIGVGVSILSYAGGVQFGLIADAGVCGEPKQIIDRFAPEFDRLLWLVLQLPWVDQAKP
ncbi:MAG: wax ester/triacylglycerol synthase family O-acyltransferase [Aquabacterium sp.]